jgi:hypothetical protein
MVLFCSPFLKISPECHIHCGGGLRQEGQNISLSGAKDEETAGKDVVKGRFHLTGLSLPLVCTVGQPSLSPGAHHGEIRN